MLSSIENEKLAQRIFLAVLVGLGLIIFYSLSDLLSVFLTSIIFYVLGKPVIGFFENRLKLNTTLSIWIFMLISIVVIVLPVILVSNAFYAKLKFLLQDVSIDTSLMSIDNKLFSLIGIRLISPDNIQKIQEFATSIFANMLSESANFMANTLIMYFIVYYMLQNSENIETWISEHLEFSPEDLAVLGKELEVQIYSNALGTPILAILQGIVACFGYWLFNVPDPFFWGLISGAFSLIPFVGTTLIWLPAGLIKLMQDQTLEGIGILAYGGIVISMVDNLFRFVFQKRIADVHPLITILGVLGGLKLFGLAGLIFGPLMLSYFLILLKIYRKLGHSTRDSEAEMPVEK
ncbi:MAG: AI-2E family transporter [Bacteroidia bacterium]|nr:AI-2E family transporter [Bacteroidia bacterium]